MATEPLVVRPKDAFVMIGVKRTKGFQLLRNGTLEKVRLGNRSIGVTMASIKAFVAERTVARPAPRASSNDAPVNAAASSLGREITGQCLSICAKEAE